MQNGRNDFVLERTSRRRSVTRVCAGPERVAIAARSARPSTYRAGVVGKRGMEASANAASIRLGRRMGGGCGGGGSYNEQRLVRICRLDP